MLTFIQNFFIRKYTYSKVVFLTFTYKIHHYVKVFTLKWGEMEENYLMETKKFNKNMLKMLIIDKKFTYNFKYSNNFINIVL
jgi:hypothetical protein